MRLFGWWTRGAGDITAPAVGAGQWAYPADGHRQRVFGPRARGDVLVLPGDIKDPDPVVDTWEGEAT